jgi:hypothetical protein
MNSVEIAKQKLQETDWAVLPDVETRLTNKQDFVNYRAYLRNIVVQNLTFSNIPNEPVAVWSAPTPVSVEGV